MFSRSICELKRPNWKHQAQTRPYCFHPLGEHSHLMHPDPPVAHTEPPRILMLTSAESLIANRICSHKGLNNCHVLCMIVADTKSCRDASSLLKTHLFKMKHCCHLINLWHSVGGKNSTVKHGKQSGLEVDRVRGVMGSLLI